MTFEGSKDTRALRVSRRGGSHAGLLWPCGTLTFHTVAESCSVQASASSGSSTAYLPLSNTCSCDDCLSFLVPFPALHVAWLTQSRAIDMKNDRPPVRPSSSYPALLVVCSSRRGACSGRVRRGSCALVLCTRRISPCRVVRRRTAPDVGDTATTGRAGPDGCRRTRATVPPITIVRDAASDLRHCEHEVPTDETRGSRGSACWRSADSETYLAKER